MTYEPGQKQGAGTHVHIRIKLAQLSDVHFQIVPLVSVKSFTDLAKHRDETMLICRS